MILLDGFGIAYYRSFRECQRFYPLKKVNLIIGANNVGKSNVSRFLSEILWSNKPAIRDIDCFLGAKKNDFTFEVIINANYEDDSSFERMYKLFPEQSRPEPRILRSVFAATKNNAAKDAITFEYRVNSDNIELSNSDFGLHAPPNDMYSLWRCMFPSMSGGSFEGWRNDLAKRFNPITRQRTPAEFIPAVRQIGPPGSEAKDHSGDGIIDQLAELQHPQLAVLKESRSQFDKIDHFLKTVLETDNVRMEIPNQKNAIYVEMDGRTLPLESLGTGIHEVIILAAKCTIFQKKLVCIEEPELHMHPTLQRKLLRYLHDHTDNQYVITTHSAHFLDVVDCSIFHVRLQDGASVVEYVEGSQQRVNICADLGYHPSDLLQANSVIWVEGPSDRIYLKAWLAALDPELQEGVHYAVMFYGGRLLSHLSGEAVDGVSVEDFISLRRLNQWSAILIDSDRRKKSDGINGTKRRIVDEFATEPGLGWVTAGREVENYLGLALLESSLAEIAGGAKPSALGQFKQVYEYLGADGKKRTPNKVDLARKACEKGVDLDVLDLRERVGDLAAFIRRANGKPAS